MKLSKTLTGLAIATAAAGMFATAVPTIANAAEANIHCVGVNSCKGTSSCKTATNDCKGLNSCKGQGFVAVTAEVCDQLGGKHG